MAEHKSTPPEKNDGSIYFWAGTAFVASAIIGFCVFVALSDKRTVMEPVPALPPAQQATYGEPRPEPVGPAPQPEITPAKPQVQPAAIPAPPPEAPPEDAGPARLQLDNLAGTLKLDAPFLQVRDKIPLEHTCYRNNMSPALNWQEAPAGTQSFVVFLEKRTAGEDSFVNWIIFDIPGSASGMPPGQPRNAALPDGAKHAKSDHNIIGYIGPCELKGRITYALRVFALDKVLGLPPSIGKNDLIRAMNGHIIDAAEAEFIHYYRL